MTTKDTRGLEIEVDSRLYLAGQTEDGQDFTAECYFLSATDDEGNRWAHFFTFPGAVRHVDEDGIPHYEDVRSAAAAEVEQLLARVVERGELDMEYWHEGRPAYGSRAYQAYGQAEDVALERKEG